VITWEKFTAGLKSDRFEKETETWACVVKMKQDGSLEEEIVTARAKSYNQAKFLPSKYPLQSKRFSLL